MQTIILKSDPIIKITQVIPASRGRINQTYTGFLEDGTKVFVKINKAPHAADMFESEERSLQLLHNGGISVPKVIARGPYFLLLEYLSLEESGNIESLAVELACIHSHTNNYYGSNYCTYQGNNKINSVSTETWLEYFQEYRWKPLFDKILAADEENLDIWVVGMKIYDIMNKLFLLRGQVELSLLHGDLNPGNCGYVLGNPVFYDCSCFYGDNWFDIASYICWRELPITFYDKYNSLVNEIRKVDITNPIFKLYFAYITMCGYQCNGNTKLLQRSLSLCDELLNLAPKSYPSLILNKSDELSDVLLVQCGSYNPVHINHVRNLYIARHYFTSQGKNVSLMMVPAPATRIRSKCKNRGYSLNKRVKMLQAATNNLDIMIDLSQSFGEPLIEHLKSLISSSTEIVLVCGADTLEYNRNHIPSNIHIIAVERNGYNVTCNNNSNITIISNNGEKTMSSTLIRSITNIEKYVHPQVIKYINK